METSRSLCPGAVSAIRLYLEDVHGAGMDRAAGFCPEKCRASFIGFCRVGVFVSALLRVRR